MTNILLLTAPAKQKKENLKLPLDREIQTSYSQIFISTQSDNFGHKYPCVSEPTQNKYNNEVIKVPPSRKTEKKFLSFSKLNGETADEIEKEVVKLEPRIEKTLESIKKNVTQTEYGKILLFFKNLSNDLCNEKVEYIGSNSFSEPLTAIAVELNYYPDSYKKDLDALLSNFKRYLLSQKKDLGFIFSLNGHCALAQDEKGIQIAKNLLKELHDAKIAPHEEHFLLLEDCVASYMKEYQTKGSNYCKDDKERLKFSFEYLECLQPKFSKAIIRLEKLKLGTGEHFRGWIKHFFTFEDIPRWQQAIDLLHRYTECLALHGETDIDDAVKSFNLHKIKPNENLINNLLKLHRYSGLLRISRLIDPDQKEGKQETFEKLIEEFIKNLEDKNYNTDSKIATILLPGVVENSGGDVFSNITGIALKQLKDGGYKILPFEIDKDSQIDEALWRTSMATKNPSNLIFFAGHGSVTGKAVDGVSINLGNTKRPSAFIKVNPDELNRIKRERSKYLKDCKDNDLLPLWTIDNVAYDSLTNDKAAFDKEDTNIMADIKRRVAPSAIGIFCSCGSAAPDKNGKSLASILSDHTNMKIYAADQSIRDIKIKINNGEIINVEYSIPIFEKLHPETKIFTPSKK